MKPFFNKLNSAINGAVINGTERSKLVAVTLAFSLANKTHLPTEPVENPVNFLNTTVMADVTRVVSSFNEEYVVDCKTTVEYFQAFWMIRYRAAHPTPFMVQYPDFSFFESAIGASTLVPSDVREFMNTNKMQIANLFNVFLEVIDEIRGQ